MSFRDKLSLDKIDFGSIFSTIVSSVMGLITYVYNVMRKATVKDTIRYWERKWRDLKWAVRNPTKLNWVQAIILFCAIAVVILLTITQLSSAWEENRPDLLAGMLKFVAYVVIPVITAGSVVFGMYLERNFQKFDDLAEFYGGVDQSIRSLLGY